MNFEWLFKLKKLEKVLVMMAATGGSETASTGEPDKASMAELDKNFQESLQTSLRLILEVSKVKTRRVLHFCPTYL